MKGHIPHRKMAEIKSMDQPSAEANHESLEHWQLVTSPWELAQQACREGDIQALQLLLQGSAVMADVQNMCRLTPNKGVRASLLTTETLHLHMMLLKFTLHSQCHSGKHNRYLSTSPSWSSKGSRHRFRWFSWRTTRK